MSETMTGTSPSTPNITLGMIRAGVAAFLEWNSEEEDPEALVWAICEAILAAAPAKEYSTIGTLFEAPPQGGLRLVTTPVSLLSQATLSEQGRPTAAGQAGSGRNRRG